MDASTSDSMMGASNTEENSTESQIEMNTSGMIPMSTQGTPGNNNTGNQPPANRYNDALYLYIIHSYNLRLQTTS